MGNPVNAILNDPPVQAAPSPGDRALEHFLAAGFVRIEPPILHPAATFLDMSGEEIRGRLFLTNGASGEELCLRPEYTIPVCRAYLASPEAGRVAAIFLSRPGLPSPGRTAGGSGRRTHSDRARKLSGARTPRAADAEIFALAMEAARDGRRPARSTCGSATPISSTACWHRSRCRTSGCRRLRRGRRARAQPLEPSSTRAANSAQRAIGRAGRAWKAPTTPGPRRWSRICSRSPASPPSAAAAPARSPIASSSRRRCGRASAIEAEKRKALEALSRDFRRSRRGASGKLRALADDAGLDIGEALDSFDQRTGFLAARGVADRAIPASAPAFVRDSRLLHRLRLRGASIRRGPTRGRRSAAGATTGWRDASAPATDIPAVGAAICDRPPSGQGNALMAVDAATSAEAPFVLAVPSKGRLQENAAAFFARAGLELVQGRGARDYRGVADRACPASRSPILSASEIVGQLAARRGPFRRHRRGSGAREDRRTPRPTLELLSAARLRSRQCRRRRAAAPGSTCAPWPISRMSRRAYRARRGERMRVATKYVNLTRRFFAEQGVGDYRIVESLGATEGAPAAGAAELIVDITTTGATLAANALKTLDDGIILRSQANARRLAHARLGARRASAIGARHPRCASPRPRKRERRAKCAHGCRRARIASSKRPPSVFDAVSRRSAKTPTRMASSPCTAPATKPPTSPAGCSRKGPNASASPPSNRCSTRVNPLYDALEKRIGAVAT